MNDQRSELPLTTEQPVHPRLVFANLQRVPADQRLERMVDQNQLDIRFRDERAHECPGAWQVEVVCAGARVPACALVRVEVADVDVSPRLVAQVRRQVPALFRADVADVQLGAARELLMNLADGAAQVLHGLLRAPGVCRVDQLPTRIIRRHLNRVEQAPAARRAE
jgi:hypothetical protein